MEVLAIQQTCQLHNLQSSDFFISNINADIVKLTSSKYGRYIHKHSDSNDGCGDVDRAARHDIRFL